ncbi:hypothetical protein BDR06DRAFT_1005280 [Suillus hirtellus]|nr:hypothetical protein BDR06DRAFT_1005280 [Suillus hirtellus]
MTPQALLNWHSIGHDDPWVARHAWRKQVCVWEALGDNSYNLPVVPNISTGLLTVNLPSPPVPSPAPVPSPTSIIPSPLVIARPSSIMTPKVQDKGKSKATSVNLKLEVGGSNKRKSPIIFGHSSQPPKLAMKACKHINSTQLSKSKPFVESEDDEDPIVQPISHEVPEVVLPQHSTIVKQAFGPASLTASSRLEVMKSPISRPFPISHLSVSCPEAQGSCPEAWATSGSRLKVEESSDDTSSASDGDPPANTIFDITIPSPEQDAKIDTLQCLHESLWRMVVNRHPSFSLPDTLADASMLLDQGGPPPSMSPLPSALSKLINLDISVMKTIPLMPEHGSAMVGPMVEPTQVQPEGPQSSSEIVLLDEPGNLLPEFPGDIVVPNEPGNLLPEYDSSDKEMNVEGKVDLPGKEVEMAT